MGIITGWYMLWLAPAKTKRLYHRILLAKSAQLLIKRTAGYCFQMCVIVCGERKYEENKFDTLLNPSVIFEILSPSTRSIDKRRKFFFYKEITSLQEYIMIDSQKRLIQLACKQDDGNWKFEDIKDPATPVFIRTIDFHLPFGEIYRDTGL